MKKCLLIILFLSIVSLFIGCGPGMRHSRRRVHPTHRNVPTYRVPTHHRPTVRRPTVRRHTVRRPTHRR